MKRLEGSRNKPSKGLREMQEEEPKMRSKELKKLHNREKSGFREMKEEEPRMHGVEPKRLLSKDKLGCNVIISLEEIEKHLNRESDESRENAKLCNVNKSWRKEEPSCRHVLNLQ